MEEMNIAQKLIKGSAEIDRMKSDIGQLAGILSGYLAKINARLPERADKVGKRREGLRFSHGTEEWIGDDFCYVVENGNTHLKRDGKMMFASKRISLVIKEHKSKLSADEASLAKEIIIGVMSSKYHLSEKDFFIKSTMGTFADHYHVHAYVPPFSDDGIIIPAG